MKGVKTDSIVQPIVYADPFKDIELSAKSAIVWDVKEGRAIYSHNPDMLMPLASLTKVMMAVTAESLVPDYTVVTIRKEFLEEEGDSGLLEDENWTLKDLLDFSLVASSNDGARAIASVVGAVSSGSASYDIGRKEFIERMNEMAKKIGLTSMYFTNENGLDSNESLGGAYGTVRDVAKLFDYTLRNSPELLESTKHSSSKITSLSNVVHTAKNTNSSVDKIPGVIGSKTGFTTLAQGNLAVVFDAELGRPLVISVLGSTFDGRFTDVEKLITASRKYLGQQSGQGGRGAQN
jgi:D-alanyl-D-alanine carboxypeptidase